MDSQLRALKPLYLPPATSAAFSSCEAVQAPVLRHPAGSLAPADAALYVTDALRQFGWQAPIRNCDSVLSAMQHAAALDLSGQELPPGCISLLAQHMTRLRSLKLDACSLTKSDLALLAAFSGPAAGAAERAGLSRLSLAAVQVTPPAQPAGQRGISAPAKAPAAAAASMAPDAAADEWVAAGATKGVREAGQVLDAIVANPLTHLDIGTNKVRARAAAGVVAACTACMMGALCRYPGQADGRSCTMYVLVVCTAHNNPTWCAGTCYPAHLAWPEWK